MDSLFKFSQSSEYKYLIVVLFFVVIVVCLFWLCNEACGILVP